MQETITGTVGRFIYRTDTFAIFKLNDIIALGEVAGIREGDRLTVTGSWQDHPRYGKQLRVETWEKPVPSTREAATDFLSSGLIKGIGPVLAERIVDTLGPDAVNVIIKNPEALKRVKGIGRKAPEVHRQLQETYQVQQVVTELIRSGLTLKTALKAYKRFGRVAAEYVQRNPYCLTELELIGFHKADEIARRMGLDPGSPFRIKSGVLHVLNEALWNEGHTYLPKDVLVSRSLELLNHSAEGVSDAMAEKTLNSLDELRGGDAISLKWARKYEEEIARDVKRLSRRFDVPPLPGNLLKGMTLTPDQENAVRVALGNGFSILTGGPGVGKTQTVRAVIRAFELQNPWGKVILCAPTGRAARRLSELTGHHAHTIHKLLGLREDRAAYNRNNPLRCDLLITDEASMMCLVTSKRLLEAVPAGARVLFVGDVDQLPPVGPGNVLRDLLDKVPTIRLTRIFRQAAESQIITNAHQINEGRMPLIDRSRDDFVFLEREDPEDIAKCVKTCVLGLGCDPLDVQVLSPMRKGPVGTVELNKLIQEGGSGREIRYGPYTYRVGDKVIHTRNNYEKMVFNGDIGVVVRVGGGGLIVRYNGDVVEYAPGDLEELEPAAACTIHKCVHPETLVETPDGVIPIADIPARGTIATAEGPRFYCNKTINPPGRLLRITTEDGYELRVTPEHGLWAWTGDAYERREAQELTTGTFLRFRLGATCDPSTFPTLPESPDVDVRARVHRIPRELDPEVAEFFGLMVADGSIFPGGIRLLKRHVEVAHRFSELAQRLFGVTPKHARKSGAYAVEVCSTQIARWLTAIGCMSPNAKAVPTVVMRAPLNVQAVFLRGLFEDGTANVKVTADRLTIDHLEWASSDKALARVVHTLLLRQGIAATRTTRADGDRVSHRIYIYGSFIERFADQIGFISGMKSARLRLARSASTRYQVPVAREVLHLDAVDAPGNARWIVQNGRHRGYVSRDSAQHIPELRLALGFHHSRIVRIEEDFGPSMCVEVPRAGRFLQNGCDGANSQGSEFKAVIIPVTTSHYVMLHRNLIYTAITRAREKVILVGTKKALAIAVGNNRPIQRYTMLAEIMENGPA